MVIVGLVLLVVVGPRELPKLLRAVGSGLNKLREMSAELRDQSGIDEIIKDENLRDDLNAIRSLSRGNVVSNLMREATRAPRRAPRKATPLPDAELSPPEGIPPDADKEYPEVGCDAYSAEPDDAEPNITGLHHPSDVAPPARDSDSSESGRDSGEGGGDSGEGGGETI